MFYKKYQLYEEQLEIMIPSELKFVTGNNTDGGVNKKLGDSLLSNYNWITNNRKVTINVMRGGNNVNDDNLTMRLQSYFSNFQNSVSDFECVCINKKHINGKWYGEIQHTSDMMGYRFFNDFILGEFQESEIIVTQQCFQPEKKLYSPVFENVFNSIRVKSLKNEDLYMEKGQEYDS